MDDDSDATAQFNLLADLTSAEWLNQRLCSDPACADTATGCKHFVDYQLNTNADTWHPSRQTQRRRSTTFPQFVHAYAHGTSNNRVTSNGDQQCQLYVTSAPPEDVSPSVAEWVQRTRNLYIPSQPVNSSKVLVPNLPFVPAIGLHPLTQQLQLRTHKPVNGKTIPAIDIDIWEQKHDLRKVTAYWHDFIEQYTAMPAYNAREYWENKVCANDPVEQPVNLPMFRCRHNPLMPVVNMLVVTHRHTREKKKDIPQILLEYVMAVCMAFFGVAQRRWCQKSATGNTFTERGAEYLLCMYQAIDYKMMSDDVLKQLDKDIYQDCSIQQIDMYTLLEEHPSMPFVVFFYIVAQRIQQHTVYTTPSGEFDCLVDHQSIVTFCNHKLNQLLLQTLETSHWSSNVVHNLQEHVRYSLTAKAGPFLGSPKNNKSGIQEEWLVSHLVRTCVTYTTKADQESDKAHRRGPKYGESDNARVPLFISSLVVKPSEPVFTLNDWMAESFNQLGSAAIDPICAYKLCKHCTRCKHHIDNDEQRLEIAGLEPGAINRALQKPSTLLQECISKLELVACWRRAAKMMHQVGCVLQQSAYKLTRTAYSTLYKDELKFGRITVASLVDLQKTYFSPLNETTALLPYQQLQAMVISKRKKKKANDETTKDEKDNFCAYLPQLVQPFPVSSGHDTEKPVEEFRDWYYTMYSPFGYSQQGFLWCVNHGTKQYAEQLEAFEPPCIPGRLVSQEDMPDDTDGQWYALNVEYKDENTIASFWWRPRDFYDVVEEYLMREWLQYREGRHPNRYITWMCLETMLENECQVCAYLSHIYSTEHNDKDEVLLNDLRLDCGDWYTAVIERGAYTMKKYRNLREIVINMAEHRTFVQPPEFEADKYVLSPSQWLLLVGDVFPQAQFTFTHEHQNFNIRDLTDDLAAGKFVKWQNRTYDGVAFKYVSLAGGNKVLKGTTGIRTMIQRLIKASWLDVWLPIRLVWRTLFAPDGGIMHDGRHWTEHMHRIHETNTMPFDIELAHALMPVLTKERVLELANLVRICPTPSRSRLSSLHYAVEYAQAYPTYAQQLTDEAYQAALTAISIMSQPININTNTTNSPPPLDNLVTPRANDAYKQLKQLKRPRNRTVLDDSFSDNDEQVQ